MTSPERIPLLVTVGVSGHRKPEQLGDVDALREAVASQFAQFSKTYREENGNVQFLLFSPLADGADRLVVDAVWQVQPEARLVVPMPFEQARYEESFFDSHSVDQFRGYLKHPNCIEAFVLPGGTQGEYLDVGKFVVDHSDLMFFLHDGKDSAEGALDGGTASILRYATASVTATGPEGQRKSMAGHEGICCHINTTSGQTSVFAAGKAPGGDEVPSSLFRNQYAEMLAPEVDCAIPGDRPVFHQNLEQFSQANYDMPAARYQARFDSQSTVVAAFALVISLLVLMDWGTGGNDFFQPLGDWKKIINWDSMSCAGLVCLVIWVLSLRGKQVLSGWLDNRYLAEKLRCTGVFLESGVPLWSVMRRNPLDPAYSQLERVWHSLYLYWRQQYLVGAHEPLSSAALKRFLLDDKGLFHDQLAWHLRKAEQKSVIQARYGWGRNLLFALSLFVSATAAIIVVLEIETADYANMLDVASSFLSLLLAGVATLGQLKEHGKVARRYRHTARQLATVHKAIEYTQMGQEEHQLAALRHHVLLGARVLMQTTDSWMFTMKEKDVDFT